jgi:hypothetical protein
MLDKVRGWVPPTPDHQGLKDFMEQQLTISMDKYEPEEPAYIGFPKIWHKERINNELKQIEYHRKAYREECERTADRNEWLADLRKSIESEGKE